MACACPRTWRWPASTTSPWRSFVNPPLTTVLQDTSQAGEVLVDSLLRLIRGEPVESAMLPVKLMVRRSSLR